MQNENQFRSGFITLLGRPNAGKSTLLNTLIGEKAAIVSPKPQTTRSRVIGILTDEHSQMVFVDTPGVHQPKNMLGEWMEKIIKDAVSAVDALVLVCDVTHVTKGDHALCARFAEKKGPRFLVLNKIDLVHPQSLLKLIADFSVYNFTAIIPVSAKKGDGTEELKKELLAVMPQGPRYFPEGVFTDQSERQLCAELIREKALYNLKEEVPHGIGVEIFAMTDLNPDFTEIHANLYCERAAHKGIIIGKQGSMLTKIGSQAREDIELLLGRHVNLQLWVKVKPNWRNSNNDLKTLGYSD